MWISIRKDWDWYLAEVEWYENIYAYGKDPEEAKSELIEVLEMMIDYHGELIEAEKKLKEQLLSPKKFDYAV
jgi:predicted RNase H-like HicB family nuclease